jgi:type I restriction enzyme S subunit
MVEDGEYPFFTCARESYRINRYAFDAEALLVSGNGANVGYVHYYKGKFNAYQRTYVLSDFTVDVHFLKMFLDRNLQDRIRVEVNAGNTPYVTMGTLAEMEVVLPSDAAEQRAIATALSDVDGLLGGLDRLITKKRDLKQAAMQQLLTGQTRLPGFHGEWEVKRLGDVAQADWGNTSITKDTYQDHGYAAFSASGQDGYVSWFEHDGPGVVISAIGAQCGKTWLALGRWTPIKNTIWFKGNGHDACTEFLYWKTWDREFWPKSGQAQPFVSVGSVRNAFVTVPRTLAEQTAIAEVLTDMDAELAVLEQRREKTHALKQAMMQELLTGRIRLV